MEPFVYQLYAVLSRIDFNLIFTILVRLLQHKSRSMNKLANFLLLTSLVLTLIASVMPVSLFANVDNEKETTINYNNPEGSQDAHSVDEEHAETVHEEGGHHTSLEPLFFIILALLIGAATRHFLQRSPLPFTVMLLIFGLIAGLLVRLGLFETWNFGFTQVDVSIMSRSIKWAANIDPHLLLFTFLPVLIFEAAFAMDVHTFKKSFTNAVLLAVPGIIIALALTAAIMMGVKAMGIGVELWTWEVALMFGAVISATDPVAVVALLKDLGASKKLGTLIEGESLLNDGTAIVLFMVFFLGMTGEAAGGSPIIEFFRVAVGGVLVGVVIGYVSITWLQKVFNDALVEISVIIGAAYLTFFVAEHFLHVSGVLALVSLGLMMAGIGRTRISPEVEHFMHEFWEVAGFIANTLLFLIVGVVIAERSIFSLKDFFILGIIYIGIHIVRAIVITILYPFMKRAGYGLPVKDAYVVWYGALRGAIGLALALIVAGVDDKYIPLEIRNQFLFYTAGIVTLTLLINATTIKFLVNRLGLTKLTPEKQMMIKTSLEYIRHSTERALEKIKKNRYTSKANFDKVEQYLPKTHMQFSDIDVGAKSSIYETRRRILEKEKSSYWSQFKEGMLGPSAVNRLTDGINEIIDSGGMKSLSDRKDLEQEWKTPELLSRVQATPFLRRIAQRFFFERLAVSYDSAVGFVMAQEETLKLLDSMVLSAKDDEERKALDIIENEINENRIHGLTFLRNIRNSYPEVYTAISTRQAIRSMLNAEKHTLDRLVHRGRIDAGEAHKMTHNIEVRMKRLVDSPPSFDMPETIELMRGISWLKDLEYKKFKEIVGHFQNRIYSVDQALIKARGKDEGMFVIVRGKVKIEVNGVVVDILGPGAVIGEMSILTNCYRTATVTAESPVTSMWISASNMKKAINIAHELEDRLWKFAARRFVENLLRTQKPWNLWQLEEFRDWMDNGRIEKLPEGTEIVLNNEIGVLLTGQVFKTGEKKKIERAPAVVGQGDVVAEGTSKIFIVPKS